MVKGDIHVAGMVGPCILINKEIQEGSGREGKNINERCSKYCFVQNITVSTITH